MNLDDMLKNETLTLDISAVFIAERVQFMVPHNGGES